MKRIVGSASVRALLLSFSVIGVGTYGLIFEGLTATYWEIIAVGCILSIALLITDYWTAWRGRTEAPHDPPSFFIGVSIFLLALLSLSFLISPWVALTSFGVFVLYWPIGTFIRTSLDNRKKRLGHY